MRNVKRIIAVILISVMSFQPGTITDAGESISYEFSAEGELQECLSTSASNEYGISLLSMETYSHSYGEQLDDLSKEIYDAYVSYYDINRNTNELVYTLENPITFDAQLDASNSLVENDSFMEAKTTLQEAVQCALDAFTYDMPEVFWMRGGSYSYNIGVSGESLTSLTGKIKAITFEPKEIYTGSSAYVDEFDLAVESVVETIKNHVGSATYRYDLLKFIHDYICDNAYYKSSNTIDTHSAEPFFIGDGGIVCEGYSKVFKILCDKFNIPCACISGTSLNTSGSSEGHMWNYVQMEDSLWYLVDVTWDDQESRIYDTYFLAGWNSQGFNNKTIINERVERTDFSNAGIKNFIYPVLNYDGYTKNSQSLSGNETEKSTKETEETTEEVQDTTVVDNVSSISPTEKETKENVPEQFSETTAARIEETVTDKTVTEGTTTDIIVESVKNTSSEVTKQSHADTQTYRISLSETTYTYTGKVIQPEVSVIDGDGNIVSPGNYTVNYIGDRTSVGTHAVIVTFIKDYTGTETKYFTIVPKGTKISKLRAGSRKIKVTVRKQKTQTTGYEIQYATSRKFTKTKTKIIKKNTRLKVLCKKLKRNTKYYVRVRTYIKVNGQKYYSSWSKIKSVKTKK